jgi:hypothetical protein
MSYDNTVSKRNILWFEFDGKYLHVQSADDGDITGAGSKISLSHSLVPSDGFTVYPTEQKDVTSTFQVRNCVWSIFFAWLGKVKTCRVLWCRCAAVI